MIEDLTALSLEDFLNRTADRTPIPGGGGVTGLVGALACALARMVAGYSIHRKTDTETRAQIEDVLTRLNRCDQLLRGLITQDALAYEAMTRITKPSSTDNPPPQARQDAILGAIAVPMEMAALISQVLTTLDDFKGVASRYLLSDLGIAAVLARATARAARYTVLVNLAELDDHALRNGIEKEINETLARCESRASAIESLARGDV